MTELEIVAKVVFQGMELALTCFQMFEELWLLLLPLGPTLAPRGSPHSLP